MSLPAEINRMINTQRSTQTKHASRIARYALRLIHNLLLVLFLAACSGQVISGPTPMPPQSLAVMLPSPTSISTLSPRQLTPEPTATPAPTPTPVIYIVQPGDTLLGIALQYDVTVDGLQAINGVLSPETLQIGQRLIIPVGGFTVPSSSGGIQLPTPTPVGVEVQHTALYQTPVGSIWVLGEVVNPGTTALENVQVQVALLDAAGKAIAADAQFVALEAVMPNGRAPFGVLFANPPTGVVSFEANIIRAELSRNVEARYVQLSITDPKLKLEGSIYHVVGSIANDTANNAVQVHIIATIYDTDRHVIGYRRTVLAEGSISAGSSLPFDVVVSADPSAKSVADYLIVAQGRVGQ